MSDANRVLWSEGLFLRTQHFQQQDRFFEATVRGALQAGQLHTFGFQQLTLDQSLQRVFGGKAGAKQGGFFPTGLNGTITSSTEAAAASKVAA